MRGRHRFDAAAFARGLLAIVAAVGIGVGVALLNGFGKDAGTLGTTVPAETAPVARSPADLRTEVARPRGAVLRPAARRERAVAARKRRARADRARARADARR